MRWDLNDFLDWSGVIIAFAALLAIALLLVVDLSSADRKLRPAHTYTVESFTSDLTVRVQCSGDCDLASMIAEAREAVEK